MSDAPVVPSGAVVALRRKAKKLVKERGIAHHAALDAVVRSGGVFTDWHHFIDAAKATEPTERAFKAGLVVGIDPKEADERRSSLREFVCDERLVVFVLWAFEKEHAKPWSEVVQDIREEFDELVYFRSLRTVPRTHNEAWEFCRVDFFFPPRYVRVRGKARMLYPEDDGDV